MRLHWIVRAMPDSGRVIGYEAFVGDVSLLCFRSQLEGLWYGFVQGRPVRREEGFADVADVMQAAEAEAARGFREALRVLDGL